MHPLAQVLVAVSIVSLMAFMFAKEVNALDEAPTPAPVEAPINCRTPALVEVHIHAQIAEHGPVVYRETLEGCTRVTYADAWRYTITELDESERTYLAYMQQLHELCTPDEFAEYLELAHPNNRALWLSNLNK